MKKIYLFVLLLTGLAMFACESDKKETRDEHTSTVEEVEDSKELAGICLWDKVALREAPEEKGKWITAINLGEKVVFLNETQTDLSSSKKREYIKVSLQGGKEGWVIKDFIALKAKAAVLTEDTDIYQRPDLLTKAGKSYSKLDVVAIVNEQDDWVEIKGKRKNGTWIESGWVKAGNLTSNDVDIAVAVYTSKALQIKDVQKQKDEVAKIVNNQDLQSSIFISDLRSFITPVLNTTYTNEEEAAEPATSLDE